MEKDHPILLITTSKQCGSCKGIKGENEGWPVRNDDTSAKTLPFKAKKPYKWNEEFFVNLLTAGRNDGVQRIEIFEAVYDTLQGAPELLNEFSIFSLEKGKLAVNKFKKNMGNDNSLLYAKYDQTISNQKWKIESSKNFYSYRDSWIPTKYISKFLYFYPGFTYTSSIIWYANIKSPEEYPLYSIVPGLKTVHLYNDHTKYMVQQSNTDKEDVFKDPVEIIKMLLISPEKYHYPIDHGRLYLKIRN